MTRPSMLLRRGLLPDLRAFAPALSPSSPSHLCPKAGGELRTKTPHDHGRKDRGRETRHSRQKQRRRRLSATCSTRRGALVASAGPGRAARVRPHALRARAGGGPRAATRRKPSPTLPRPPSSTCSAPRRQRRRRSPPHRPRGRARAAGARDVTVLEVVNDNMPFLLDSTLAELVERGLRAAARGAPDPRRRTRRERRARAPRRRGDRAARGRARGARASSTSTCPRIDDPEAREPPDRGAAPRLRRRAPSRCTTGPACAPASPRSSHTYRLNPPPLPDDEVNGGDRLPRLARRATTSPSSACANTACRRATPPPIRSRASGLGAAARSRVQVLRRGARARRHDAGDPRLPGAAAGRSSSPRRT